MNFANPGFLWLISLLGALVALREWGSPRIGARLPFPSENLLKALPQTPRVRFARLPWMLLYAGLFLSVVALARPRSVLKGAEARARGIDILIALDTSGSMRALDFDPLDRMAMAKRATKSFISHRQYDRIGLLVFAGVAMLQCPLTLDYGALIDFLDQVSVGQTSTENTAIGTAIAAGCNHLKRGTAKSKIMILVTDGRNNSGEIDPITATKAAVALGIKIYTIGVGIHGQSMLPVDTVWGKQLVPIQEDLDEASLQEIAQTTGGRYFRASSTREFEEIYSEIDRLEKSEIKGPAPVEYQDHYLRWLVSAMLLVSAGLVLRGTVWRGVP